MKIYFRKEKTTKGDGQYYFGDYGEIPIGLSQTLIDEKDRGEFKDPPHYHKAGREFYLTIKGKAILEVAGKDLELTNDQLVMVEPGEKHHVKEVTEVPFSMITICTSKAPEDKVVI